MESSNGVSLQESDDFMPVQSANPITQMGGDDGHLPMSAGLLSLGSTCDIHTSKKKINASNVDSVLVLLPGMLELRHRPSSRSSSFSTIGRLEGFHQQGGSPSLNSLTLTLGGGSSGTNSSKVSSEKTEDDVLATESPKIVLRGRAIPSKTTFVLLHVTASAKSKTNKKQPPPKVVCKGVYRNVLVFGEGTVVGSPLQSDVDESPSIARRWRHYGASERGERDHCDLEEDDGLASSMRLQNTKQHDDVVLPSSSSSFMRKYSVTKDVNDPPTQMNTQLRSIDGPKIADVESDDSCYILNEVLKEPPRRLSARKSKQRVSYEDIDENEDAEDIDDADDAKPGIAKKVKLAQVPITSARKRENSRKRRTMESLADDVVFVDAETDITEQTEVVGIVDSKRESKMGDKRKESNSEVIALSSAQSDDDIELDSNRPPVVLARPAPSTDASAAPSKDMGKRTSFSNTIILEPEANAETIDLDSRKDTVSLNRLPPTSALSTPSASLNAIASTPNGSSKKRRRRPIASTPSRAKARVFTLDEDDEFAFLGE